MEVTKKNIELLVRPLEIFPVNYFNSYCVLGVCFSFSFSFKKWNNQQYLLLKILTKSFYTFSCFLKINIEVPILE